jgi:hypothetical protein
MAANKSAREQIEKRISGSLLDLASTPLMPSAGYRFQDWFFDLVDFFEMTQRRPYMSGRRQIDDSVTVEGTTYLIELKFTKEQSGAPDVDTFLAKVNDKADNTMGEGERGQAT